DPSDYSVAANGTIEVQATETLGHYAEWLDLRASHLRAINRERQYRVLSIGSRLRLDFSHVSVDEFHRRRLEHHRDLQEAFFDRNEIERTRVHVTQSGDSLWGLAADRYRLPLWLLRQYNPDLNLNQLRAGTRIVIPVLKTRNPS
ncbi:MAG: LysM domain-containing protein, partial [Myxococcota bacterium]